MFRTRQLTTDRRALFSKNNIIVLKESVNRRKAEMERKRKYWPADVSIRPDRCAVMKGGGGMQGAYDKARNLSGMQK
jgi:hypothetical protein